MIYAVCGTKGGIGKTTLAMQLATAHAIAARKVWLIDGDAQGSAIASATARADRQELPQFAASWHPDGAQLRAQVRQQAAGYDVVVIDAGGRDSSALRAALMLADVAIVPVRPRSYDIWALDDMAKLIEQAQAQRDGLRAVAVLNMADPGVLASDNADAAEALAGFPALADAGVTIRQRKALAQASAAGLHITEARPRDEKAEREIAAFVRTMSAHCGDNVAALGV